MNMLSRVAGVVLATAALAGAGAGIASAATAPSTTPVAAHASMAQDGPSTARFFTYDTSTSYQLVVASYPDAGAFVNPPSTPETLQGGGSAFFDLNTAGQTVAQGVVHYEVLTSNGHDAGSFDETLGWLNDGSKTGAMAITTKNVDLPSNLKIATNAGTMQLQDINQ